MYIIGNTDSDSDTETDASSDSESEESVDYEDLSEDDYEDEITTHEYKIGRDLVSGDAKLFESGPRLMDACELILQYGVQICFD